MGAAFVADGSHGAPHASAQHGSSHAQQQPSHTHEPPTPFPGKDCRACSGAIHMFDTFKRMGIKKGSQQQAADASSSGVSTSSSTALKPAPAVAAVGVAAAAPAVAASTTRDDSSSSGTSGKEQLGGCPPDTPEIGRATWTFLHTMAAYYPEQPSGAQRSLMRSMMDGLAEFYPCSVCAEHLREQVAASPPDVTSNTTLSAWLCKIHNEVNEMLGKPVFDCGRVMERWRDGPADGSCD